MNDKLNEPERAHLIRELFSTTEIENLKADSTYDIVLDALTIIDKLADSLGLLLPKKIGISNY